MREAVVVSYARTGLAKSARGGFNMTPAMTMAAHAIEHAVEKSGVEPDAVEDVYLGNGAHGAGNLARLSGLLAGLPVTTAGRHDPAPLLVGPERHRPGGQLHQGGRRRRGRRRRRRVDLDAEPRLRRPGQHGPGARGAVPGDLHGDDRDRRHRGRALRRQPRVPGRVLAAVAAAHGRRPGERPVRRRDRADGRRRCSSSTARRRKRAIVDYVVDRDECNRPSTTIEGLAKLQPVRGEGNYITAGNASQLSDGAAAVVLMEAGRGRAPRPDAAGRVPGLGRRRLRARRDGHRAGVRRAAPAASATA